MTLRMGIWWIQLSPPSALGYFPQLLAHYDVSGEGEGEGFSAWQADTLCRLSKSGGSCGARGGADLLKVRLRSTCPFTADV